jgi:hypothetical protein
MTYCFRFSYSFSLLFWRCCSSLTPMNSVFLEKLRIFQAVKNYSAFYKTEISLPFTQELSLFPNLSLIFFKTQLILDAYMRLGLLGGFLPSEPPIKIVYSCVPHPSYFPLFTTVLKSRT